MMNEQVAGKLVYRHDKTTQQEERVVREYIKHNRNEIEE